MSETLLRYVDMLKLLSRDRVLSSTDIHRRLEELGHITSKRTVERDLNMLSLPFGLESVETSKPFGWKYASNVSVSLVPGLSETEALSFLMLKQFASQLLPTGIIDNLEPYFREARRKLSDEVSHGTVKKWPRLVRSVESNQPLLRPKIHPRVRESVYAALLKAKQVALTYHPVGQEQERSYAVVNLFGLVENGAAMYLVCTFGGYTDVRLLALHRVRAVTVLETDVVKPDHFDLDQYIADGAFGFGGEKRQGHVELRFYNNAGHHLLETHLSEDQQSEKIDSTTLIIRATVVITPRLIWWLRGFGPDVEVLGPAELREEIRQSLVRASALYEKRESDLHF